MADHSSNIKKTVAALIGTLNARNKDIVTSRFGIKTGKKQTLESIGQTYGITRERVRQIEEASLNSIRANSVFSELAAPFVVVAKNAINKAGGVLSEAALFESFSGTSTPSAANASFVFLLTLDRSLYRHAEDNDYKSFWANTKERAEQFKSYVSRLASALQKQSGVLAHGTLAEFVAQQGSDLSNLDENTLTAIFAISKKIGKNVFGEVGLMTSAEIKPRGVRDKAYLVLKRAAKPMHFRDITQLINETKFSVRKAHIQTVHNELIKDNRFILVGRGIYALSQWGYKPGTVKEVIADMIKTHGPMTRDELIAKVTDVRFVKPNTILLGIQDKKLFSEDGQGRVMLQAVEA